MKLTASLGLKFGPPLSPTNDCPRTVNSTVNSSPWLPPGKSDTAAWRAPTFVSGKMEAYNSAALRASPLSNHRHIVILLAILSSVIVDRCAGREHTRDRGLLQKAIPLPRGIDR